MYHKLISWLIFIDDAFHMRSVRYWCRPYQASRCEQGFEVVFLVKQLVFPTGTNRPIYTFRNHMTLSITAVFSRPDIAFAVSKLSQFNSDPMETHMKARVRS
jgi:hypothetical protein